MLTLRDNDTSWLIASVRFGHAAGMSQIGAYQMSIEGKSYKDILTFYYNLGSASNLVTMPWNTDNGTATGASGYTVTSVSKTGKVATTGVTLNIRTGPGTGYSVLASLNNGANVAITGQVADWWQLNLGNGNTGFVSSAFIALDPDSQPPAETQPPAKESTQPTQTKTGSVNTPGTTLNVRSGPGTTFTVIGSLKHGDKVTVSTENAAWYKLTYNFNTAYVSAAYIILDSSTSEPAPAPQSKTVYVNTPGTTLNVRSGPGIGHAIIGSLSHGDELTVTDENNEWYKLTYDGKTAYVSRAHTTATQPQLPTTPQSKTVYVNTPGITLNVRSGPSTSYTIIGSLQHGAQVTVTDENNDWYKLTYNGKTGYISKSFTQAEAISTTPSQPAQTTGTVNSSIGLNVRSGPGTNNAIIGALLNGTKVTILDQSGSWYKIKHGASDGWVSSQYIK